MRPRKCNSTTRCRGNRPSGKVLRTRVNLAFSDGVDLFMAAHDVSPDDVSNAGILTGALSTEHLVGLHLAGKEAALRGCDALDYAKEAVAADES